MSGIQMPSDKRRVSSAVAQPCFSVRAPDLRKPLFISLVALTSALGVGIMYDILQPNSVSALEACLLVLFSVTFIWIAFSFWSGAIGFVLQLLRLDPLTLTRQSSTPPPDGPIQTRTAVIMPIYNEDTARVIAGFETSLRSLEATGQANAFDFFLLSDTQDPELIAAEGRAWQALKQRLGARGEQVYYRRRERNSHRKVGNIAEFCQRWGSRYSGMIVLDADSIMTGDCMLSLVRALETNPHVGLIQTVPIPVRQETFFGRFVQFAATLYSPMLATGLAFWQTDSANYWGHNAIIRVQAFLDHCGLPPLPGKPPFGGEIESHDFVEAALLRRAGWHVVLLADLEGSYEEVPSNMLDYATRDRRWVQGNIQHLALLRAAGLHATNRLHFLMGAIAYISSLLWLIMLALSTADAVVRAVNSNVFFAAEYQLFPSWQIAKTGLIVSLLYLTGVLLFLPKVMGAAIALLYRRRAFGGATRLLAGTAVETFFAILIAPLMMVFHAYFVVSVFLGRKVRWQPQVREGRMVSWRESARRTAIPTAVALLWGLATYYLTPQFFWWLMPVLTGLVVAAPIVRYSSSMRLGRFMAWCGIFRSPCESGGHITRAVDEALTRTLVPAEDADDSGFTLPPDQWRDMPVQSFRYYRGTYSPAR